MFHIVPGRLFKARLTLSRIGVQFYSRFVTFQWRFQFIFFLSFNFDCDLCKTLQKISSKNHFLLALTG